MAGSSSLKFSILVLVRHAIALRDNDFSLNPQRSSNAIRLTLTLSESSVMRLIMMCALMLRALMSSAENLPGLLGRDSTR